MDNLTPVTFDDLVRMASRVKVPAVDPDVATITAGQVWHLQWDDVSEIGIVTEADDRWPTLVPLQFDAQADSGTIYVPSFASEAVPLWSYARHVPAVTLAGALGDCSLVTPTEQQQREDGVESAMDALSGWVVAGDGTGELPALLRATGMPVSQLARELTEERSTIIDLLRGSFVPGAALAEGLATLLGMSVTAVQAGSASLPQGLRDALTVRGVRDRVKSLAGMKRVSESRAWFDSAYGVLATPYRAAGAGDENWESRVDRFYEVNL